LLSWKIFLIGCVRIRQSIDGQVKEMLGKPVTRLQLTKRRAGLSAMMMMMMMMMTVDLYSALRKAHLLRYVSRCVVKRNVFSADRKDPMLSDKSRI